LPVQLNRRRKQLLYCTDGDLLRHSITTRRVVALKEIETSDKREESNGKQSQAQRKEENEAVLRVIKYLAQDDYSLMRLRDLLKLI